MASSSPTRKRITELEAAIRFKRYDIVDNIVRYGLKYGSFAFFAWCGKQVLVSYAGQFTFADIRISALGELKMSEAAHYTVTIGLGVWGYAERRLRQATIKRLAPRAGILEEKLDSKRTSSNLTKRGTTRKEDRL